jgi:hypothetical protein
VIRAVIPDKMTRAHVIHGDSGLLVTLWEPGKAGRMDDHRGYVMSEATARALLRELLRLFPEERQADG